MTARRRDDDGRARGREPSERENEGAARDATHRTSSDCSPAQLSAILMMEASVSLSQPAMSMWTSPNWKTPEMSWPMNRDVKEPNRFHTNERF